MATWYLIKSRLQRGFAGGLVIAVILAVLSCFLGVYQDNIDNTAQKIDDAYAALPVRVVVSDITGTRTDGLRIPDHYGMWFTEAECKEISKKSSLHYSADGREGTLLGITNLESAPELADTEGITITYLDTLDWTGNEAGCLVSKDLYHSLIPDEKGEYLLSLQLRIHQQDEKYIAFSLPVVGTYSGSGNSVYCPWTIVSTAQVSLQNYYTLESLSATVRDNKELERLREALAEKFSSVDPTATSSNTFAVTIYDDTLRQTVNEFHANLQNLNRFLPLVIILACLLSGTTSFLYIHTRRRELVLLRQLGMSIKKLLFTLGLEMTLYILLGCGTALLLQGIRPYPYTLATMVWIGAFGGAYLNLNTKRKRGAEYDE